MINPPDDAKLPFILICLFILAIICFLAFG